MPKVEPEVYHIVYHIQVSTRHYYIGMHSTRHLNDGYMGSGSIIRGVRAQFPNCTMVRTVLGTFHSRLLASMYEDWAVAEAIGDEYCLNAKLATPSYASLIRDETQYAATPSDIAMFKTLNLHNKHRQLMEWRQVAKNQKKDDAHERALIAAKMRADRIKAEREWQDAHFSNNRN